MFDKVAKKVPEWNQADIRVYEVGFCCYDSSLCFLSKQNRKVQKAFAL
jgi:hypothetical protein